MNERKPTKLSSIQLQKAKQSKEWWARQKKSLIQKKSEEKQFTFTLCIKNEKKIIVVIIDI